MPKAFLNIDDFGRGINTVKNPRDLSIGEAVEIENFDLSNRGELRPRGLFKTATDGSAVTLQSNTVPKHTASINPGRGLFYFEADDPTVVRGVSIVATGATSNPTSGADGSGHYALVFNGGNKIFIDESDFWTSNNIIPDTLPARIKITGSLNNDGVYTVVNKLSRANTQTIVGSDGSTVMLTMGGDIDNCLLVLAENTIQDENVADNTTVNIGATGFVGDNFLALGNLDDGKVDVYADSSDAFDTNAIKLTTEENSLTSSEFVFYYADNVLRTADGQFANKSEPKWFGKINRQQFVYFEEASSNPSTNISRSLPNQFYERSTSLIAPTGGNHIVSGDIDGSGEFSLNGTGWNISVGEASGEGSWEKVTYEFAGTFIYDKNQESLLKIYDQSFTPTDGFKELYFNVYADQDVLEATGVLADKGGGYGAGVTSIRTDGNSAITHFPVGSRVLDSFGRHIGDVESHTDHGGDITINFRAITNFGVADDSNLHKEQTYPDRVSGGRIYIREKETNDDWILFADIDITKGVRANLNGDYNPWVQDAEDGATVQNFRITSTANTTKGNRGFHATTPASNYWILKHKSPSLDTYASLNGFPQSTKQISFGDLGTGYKTAVVCNRRAFVANVLYNEGNLASEEEFDHFGDRIMFSQIGRYDTFPNTNSIDVIKGDGEDYVKLESYGDRILAFKQRTLQILNVASSSPANWFLEDNVEFAGIANPYSICKGEAGVVWANLNGVFLYNGSQVINLVEGKISASEWSTFCANKTMVLGYEPKEDQVIIIDRADASLHGYVYNLKTKSFSYGKHLAPNSSGSFTPIITNFVNTSKGQLISAYDVQSTNLASAGNNTVHFTEWDESPSTFGHYKLTTPDFNFNSPSTIKKIYKIYIHYRSTANVTVTAAMVYYQVNQNNTWTAFNAGSMARSESSGAGYDIAVFTPSATFECQSVAIKIEPTVTTGLYINDIQIEYRNVRKRVS